MNGEANNNFYISYDLLVEKIADIKKAISLLTKIASTGKENFLNDAIVISAAKYQLILAIEAALNICNHLAARVAREVPASYADCFRILAENKIISRELAARLIAMAKFRNLLVHQYGKVDNAIVYRIIQNDLSDLLHYIKEIRSYIKNLPGQ